MPRVLRFLFFQTHLLFKALSEPRTVLMVAGVLLTVLFCGAVLYTYTRDNAVPPVPAPGSSVSPSVFVKVSEGDGEIGVGHPVPTMPRFTAKRLHASNQGHLDSGWVFRSSATDGSLEAFQATDFYKMLIKNNLFRPLGSRPAVKRAGYKLIGTITTRTGESQAFIERLDGDAPGFLTVSVGSKLGEATVVDIQPKSVTLQTAGVATRFELESHLWLNQTGTRRQ